MFFVFTPRPPALTRGFLGNAQPRNHHKATKFGDMMRCCADVARFAGLELVDVAHEECGFLLDSDIIFREANITRCALEVLVDNRAIALCLVGEESRTELDSVMFCDISMQAQICHKTKRIKVGFIEKIELQIIAMIRHANARKHAKLRAFAAVEIAKHIGANEEAHHIELVAPGDISLELSSTIIKLREPAQGEGLAQKPAIAREDSIRQIRLCVVAVAAL